MYKSYITTEIREYVNRICEKKNITDYLPAVDEDHITALLLQAIPSHELPHITSLDLHNGLTTLIARFIAKNDGYSANELANYVKYLYVDFFKTTIRELIEDITNEKQQSL